MSRPPRPPLPLVLRETTPLATTPSVRSPAVSRRGRPVLSTRRQRRSDSHGLELFRKHEGLYAFSPFAECPGSRRHLCGPVSLFRHFHQRREPRSDSLGSDL